MNRLSDNFLQEIKDRCPVENVIADYVDLKRSGANLSGLCPFHREKTPSFVVSPTKQIFNCFGCGTGGNVFSFIMKIENVEFYDAVALLAKRAGMELPKSEDDDIAKKRSRFLQINKESARFFNACLNESAGREALTYLKNRGLSDGVIRRFGLGFAPNSWTTLIEHLYKKGFYKNEILESGMAIAGKNGSAYDRFRNRIMFPIINVRGEVTAFGGRVLDDSLPKYLNSPETIVFNKSRTLFGMNIVKGENPEFIILAEGYMDVIALHSAGFKTAVASLGTSLTPDQARLILRYSKEVIIAYDGDNAGVAASNRAISILKEAGIAVNVLTLKGAKDPDEFIKKFGKERFALALRGSDNYIEYRIAKLSESYNLEEIPQKVEFLKKVTEVLLDIESPIERELYSQKVAKDYELAPNAIAMELTRLYKAKKAKVTKEQKNKDRERLTPKILTREKTFNSKAQSAESALLALIYEHNEIYLEVKDIIKPSDFLNTLNSRIFEYFAKKLDEEREIDIALMNAEFSGDELSYIANIIAKETKYDNPSDGAKDFCGVILNERKKLLATSGEDENMKEMIEWYEIMKKKKK